MILFTVRAKVILDSVLFYIQLIFRFYCFIFSLF